MKVVILANLFVLALVVTKAFCDDPNDNCFQNVPKHNDNQCQMHDGRHVCICKTNECYFYFNVEKLVNYILITVNGGLEFPMLIVDEGSIVVVDVFNNLTEDTSIHWHGLYQFSTPWIDGVGNITQFPIQAGGKFRYIFKAAPPGTFWYHSHVRMQTTRGVFGPLIVRENLKPDILNSIQDQPEKHTINLGDIILESVDVFQQKPRAKNKQNIKKCRPDGIRVRDFPGFANRREAIHGNSLINFHVHPVKTYRFRLIGSHYHDMLMVSIDYHKLSVVATDGYFVEPRVTDYIIIHTGERYDFLLTAIPDKHVEQQSFLIRVQTLDVDCKTGEYVGNLGFACLVYGDSSNNVKCDRQEYEKQMSEVNPRNCTFPGKRCTMVNCPFPKYPWHPEYECITIQQLKSLNPTPEEFLPLSDSIIPSDRTWFFNFVWIKMQNESTPTINQRKFMLPYNRPLQAQNYSSLYKNDICEYSSSSEQNPCIHIIDIPQKYHNQSVRFVLSSIGQLDNSSLDAHPVHLHGHSFRVVKMGYAISDENGKITAPTADLKISDNNIPFWATGKSVVIPLRPTAVRKDTVIVPAGGYAVIDFIADNPGHWFMHCHIEWHLKLGMAAVVRELDANKYQPPPSLLDNNKDFCWTVQEFKARAKSKPLDSYKKTDQNYSW